MRTQQIVLYKEYDAPTLDELKQFFSSVITGFSHPNDPKHTEFVLFLKACESIEGENAREAAVGASIAAAQALYNQAGWSSIFSHFGSRELYAALQTTLKLNNPQHYNVLCSKAKFVYLISFLNYAEKNPDKFNSETLKKIHQITQRLRKQLDNFIEQIFHEKPTLSTLKEALNEIEAKYLKAIENDKGYFGGYFGKKHSAHRLDMLKLTKLLITSPVKHFASESKEVDREDYGTIYGALLFIMSQIESEYYINSPEGSILYRLCQRALNIKNTAESMQKDKDHTVTDVSRFHAYIANKVDALKLAGDPVNAVEKLREVRRQLNDFIAEIENCDSLVANRRLNDYLETIIQSGASCATQFLVGAAVANMILSLGSTQMTTSFINILLQPKYTMMLLGATIAVGYLAQTSFVSFLARLITPVTATALKAPFYASKLYYSNLARFSNNEKLYYDFLMALHVAPNDIVSEKEKAALEKVVNFAEVKELRLKAAIAAEEKAVVNEKDVKIISSYIK